MYKFFNFLRKNSILIINICVFLTLTLFFFLYTTALPLRDHDCHHVFEFTYLEVLSFKYTRIVPFIITKMYNNSLPLIFNLHPADFRTNYIVCIITGCLYTFYSVFLSNIFYLLTDKTKNYFKRKESVVLLPLTFICVSFYLFNDTATIQPVFMGVRDATLFFEYLGGYFLYFIFFTKCFDIIINKTVLNKKQLFFLSITGILIGLWSEFINISAFLSIILMFIIVCCCSKELLKNKSVWFLMISFLLGFFIFYVLSGNFTISHFGTLKKFNIFEQNLQIFSFSNEFYKDYFHSLFINFKWCWTVLLSSTILLIISCSFLKDKEEKRKTKMLILLSYSLVLGILLCAFCSIFIDKSMRFGLYIFNSYYFPYVIYVVYLFAITAIVGALYRNLNKKVQIVFLILLIVFSYFPYKKFLPVYKEQIKTEKELRQNIYNIEKKFVIYSVFFEKALFSEKDIPFEYKFSASQCFNLFFSYMDFIYKHKKVGYVSMDYPNSAEEIEKREKLLGIQQEKYNLFKVIQFSPLKEYDKINLNLEELKKLKEQKGENPLLIKTEAYLYKQKNDYSKAIKLYKEYLKSNPEDIDASVNLAQIYKTQNKLQLSGNIYKNLIKYYPENIYIMMHLAEICYSQKKYRDAITLNKNIINFIQKNEEKYNDIFPVIYYDIASLYRLSGQKEKSEEWYDKIQNERNKQWLNLFCNYDKDFETFYNSENDTMLSTTSLINLFEN